MNATAVSSKGHKVPVTERALIQRINRVLRKQDMVLKTARGWRMHVDMGHYYVVNTRINGVMAHYKNCNPEALARELGVLQPYEEMVA